MKPTIRDVAREANVSIGTVDRVLHNRRGVSEKTTKKVLKAIKNLNYKPDKTAQALATHKKNIKLGVIYPDVEKYFWNEVRRGIITIQNRLEPFGVEIITKITKTYDYKEQLDAIDYLVDRQISGITMMPYHPSKLDNKIDYLYSIDIPVVNFISDAPKSKRICYIGHDDIKYGELAGKLMELYLKGQGNVVVIGVHRDVLCINRRVSGFIDKIQTEYPEIKVLGIYDTTKHSNDNEKMYRDEVIKITEMIIENLHELNGIYITNSLTSCVGHVIEKYNKKDKIKIIGHEDSTEIRDLINRGIISASICQDQYKEIIMSLNILYKYILTKEQIDSKIIHTKSHIMIKENSYY